MGIKNFFSNSFETNYSTNKENMTHFYSEDYNSTIYAISTVAKKLGYTVESVDDKYKEMLLVGPNKEIIVSVFTVSYYENSVDLKINTKYIIAMNRPAKIATNFYNELNHHLSLKRVGEHKDAI